MHFTFFFASWARDRYLLDWAGVYLVGGFVFFLFGLITGSLIWRKYRKAAEATEEKNRSAMENFNEFADDISRNNDETHQSNQD